MSSRDLHRPRQQRDRGRRHLLPAEVPGVPRKVGAALDALDDPELTAREVGYALDGYLQVVSLSRSTLWHEHNDWTEFVVPCSRGVLDRALESLPERHAALLRRHVDPADDLLRAKTVNNPRADPSLPWWARRWW